jgi:hypothetical protein
MDAIFESPVHLLCDVELMIAVLAIEIPGWRVFPCAFDRDTCYEYSNYLDLE